MAIRKCKYSIWRRPKFQFNMNAFLKPYWEWTLSAKPNLEWEKLLSLCWFAPISLANFQLGNHTMCVVRKKATLHLIEVTPGAPNEVKVVVLCHTRELAFQIQKEYERFSKYLPDIKSRVFYGGLLNNRSKIDR